MDSTLEEPLIKERKSEIIPNLDLTNYPFCYKTVKDEKKRVVEVSPSKNDARDVINEASSNSDDSIENDFKIYHDLPNMNIQIKKGQIIALIGKVGSGKSSLLNAIFGELYKSEGDIYINGSVSYVGQKCWMQAKTIKENILFNKPYDENRYQDAIKYSAMADDLKMMNDPNGT